MIFIIINLCITRGLILVKTNIKVFFFSFFLTTRWEMIQIKILPKGIIGKYHKSRILALY